MSPSQCPAWEHSFAPFSPTHAAALGAFLILTISACILASKQAEPKLRRLERTLGWTFLAIAILYLAWWLLPRNFDLQRSLPLHICDVLSFVAPFALLFQRRAITTIIVFWGLGFCTQAFVKPLMGPGPVHPEKWPQFWGFWLTHASIVFTAIYQIWVRGYRPTWKDFWFASWVAYLYVGSAFVLDAFFDLNYVYVGRGTLSGETFADDLGPWPLRVVWIALVGQAILAFVLLLRLLPASRSRSSLDSRA